MFKIVDNQLVDESSGNKFDTFAMLINKENGALMCCGHANRVDKVYNNLAKCDGKDGIKCVGTVLSFKDLNDSTCDKINKIASDKVYALELVKSGKLEH